MRTCSRRSGSSRSPASQAAINHLGIGVTARLTDFSGYWILLVAFLLTVCLLAFAPSIDASRLVTFENLSGSAGGGTWPRTEQLVVLFALGALLPAYTITGFDASAHASEETVGAARSVPRGIVRSVLVSGIAGWVFLSAVVLAAPSIAATASHGEGAFLLILRQTLPGSLALALVVGIVVAQYLCGLATVTSASRMAYAFARDGGLPFSPAVRWVCPRRRSPAVAVWAVSAAAVLFTLYTPVYSTITAVCTIFLYLSYVLPTILGARAFGRTWTAMGPWNLGRWYRPLAWISAAGCIALIVIGMQPPNERSVWVVGGMSLLLGVRLVRRASGTGSRARLSLTERWIRHDRKTCVRLARILLDLKGFCPWTTRLPAATSNARHLPFLELARAATPARILTGRVGGSYRTSTLLELRRDHAAARDAVNEELDAGAPGWVRNSWRSGAFSRSARGPARSRNSCSGPTWVDRSTSRARPRSASLPGRSRHPGRDRRRPVGRRGRRAGARRCCPFCTRRRPRAAGVSASLFSFVIAASACSTTWASCSTRRS